MTSNTEACSHCQTAVGADAVACPKCGAKRKTVEVETGSGKLKFHPVHFVGMAAGAIAGYFIRQTITPPPGVGDMISSTIMGAAVVGILMRYIVPPKDETKTKTIWVRQEF